VLVRRLPPNIRHGPHHSAQKSTSTDIETAAGLHLVRAGI
jgi:hypothetical protein